MHVNYIITCQLLPRYNKTTTDQPDDTHKPQHKDDDGNHWVRCYLTKKTFSLTNGALWSLPVLNSSIQWIQSLYPWCRLDHRIWYRLLCIERWYNVAIQFVVRLDTLQPSCDIFCLVLVPMHYLYLNSNHTLCSGFKVPHLPNYTHIEWTNKKWTVFA